MENPCPNCEDLKWCDMFDVDKSRDHIECYPYAGYRGWLQGKDEVEEIDILCRQAINKWGVESQLDMAVEECAELIKAIQKHRRGGTEIDIIEEVVDVGLMLKQLKLIFPHPLAWNNFENSKIERLKRLLNE